MTPAEQILDAKLLWDRKPLTLFRLARKRFANLSGVAAAAAPGRWNRSGQQAIYTSVEAGIPVLERLVHTPKDTIPSNLALMRIEIDGNWQQERLSTSSDPLALRTDQSTRACFLALPSLQAAAEYFRPGGKKLPRDRTPFAIATLRHRSSLERRTLPPGARLLEPHLSPERRAVHLRSPPLSRILPHRTLGDNDPSL